jgi:hypothetical protein
MPLPTVIRWVRQWGGSDRVVWVIVRKIDAAWRADPISGYYIPRGACRKNRFGDWLEKYSGTRKAWMPHIGYYGGFVSFTDGRHRFAWCRDHCVRAMPVSVESKQQAELIGRLFGSASRMCRLPQKRK